MPFVSASQTCNPSYKRFAGQNRKIFLQRSNRQPGAGVLTTNNSSNRLYSGRGQQFLKTYG